MVDTQYLPYCYYNSVGWALTTTHGEAPRIHLIVHIRQYPCCTILLRHAIYGQRGSGEITNEGHV